VDQDLLVFDHKYAEDLRSGRKRCTIRLGKRNVHVGEIRKAWCEEEEFYLYVQKVEFKRVWQLTDLDARNDGFESMRNLISVLENYYPNLSRNDWLTIINFRLVGENGNA
jgi:hypothetical protein